MNVTNQHQKTDDSTPVVSPLANDRTYGERWYSAVFDWGLNYWANLLSSAGFSQWAEHGKGKVKLPFMKESKTPREMQAGLASKIIAYDPLMNGTLDLSNIRIPFTQVHLPNIPIPFTGGGYKSKVETRTLAAVEMEKAKIFGPFPQQNQEKTFAKLAQKISTELTNKATLEVGARSMARARSLTLLIPGFFIVIPTVWIGAKIKPWFVETINRHHYGDEAMKDPSMQARHEALAAEARPTFGGAVIARIATMFAAQFTAQLIGSKGNILNEFGKKHNMPKLEEFAVDPVTKQLGAHLGSALPKKMKDGLSSFARKQEMDWSEEQIREHLELIGRLPQHSVEKISNAMRRDSIGGFSRARDIGRHGTITEEVRQLAKTGLGVYNTATQDLGRYIMADTVYTMVTALTIHPVVKLLRLIPGMSFKPKMPKNSAYFSSNEVVTVPTHIKVPANEYGELGDREQTSVAIDTPRLSISHANAQGTLEQREQQIA